MVNKYTNWLKNAVEVVKHVVVAFLIVWAVRKFFGESTRYFDDSDKYFDDSCK